MAPCVTLQPTSSPPPTPGLAYFDLPGGEGRRTSGIWFVLGTAVMVAALFILAGIVYWIAFDLSPEGWQQPVGVGPRGGFAEYLALFASFVPIFLAPLLTWRFVHGLPMERLYNAAARVRWGFVGRGFIVAFAGYSLLSLGEWLLVPSSAQDVVRQADWGAFAVLLAITLLLCPVQAASEELLVRGYLNQALVRWTGVQRIGARRAPWVAFGLTSTFFAALHAWNPEAAGQFWPYMILIGVFGIAMCALVWIEGGLESAIGFHIGNNILAFSVLGYADPDLPNSAVWTWPEPLIGAGDVLQELVVLPILVLVLLWWNRRATARS